MFINKLRLYLIALILFILTIITYWGGFQSGFIGDDNYRIPVQKEIYEKGFSEVMQEILPDRPILMMSIWFNYKIGNMNPIGYKIVNIILHFLCGLMFFITLSQMLHFYGPLNLKQDIKLIKYQFKPYEIISFLTATFFIVHPINNQAVMSVIQRGVGLSTVFSLLSLYYFIKQTENKNSTEAQFYSIIFFLFAVLSKPNTIVLPLFFVLYLKLLKNSPSKEIIKRIFIFLLICLIPIIYYQVFKISNQGRALTSVQYFLTQARVILIYFEKYLWPTSLQFFYPISTELKDIYSLKAFLLAAFHIITFLFLIVIVHKKKHLGAFFILMGYLAFLPESSFFSIDHVIFDHRNYFSFAFFVAGVQVLIWSYISRSKSQLMAYMLFNLLALSVYLRLNQNYISKIDTFFKWELYNLSGNPYQAKSYINAEFIRENIEYCRILIEQAVNDLKNDKFLSETQKKFDHIEYGKYMEFVNYYKLTKEEKQKFLLNETQYFLTQPTSLFYISFFENFLNLHVSRVYSKEESILFLNGFYLSSLRGKLAQGFTAFVKERLLSNIQDFLILHNLYKVNSDIFVEGKDLHLILNAYKNLSLLFSVYDVPIDIKDYENKILKKFGENNIEVINAFKWARNQ